MDLRGYVINFREDAQELDLKNIDVPYQVLILRAIDVALMADVVFRLDKLTVRDSRIREGVGAMIQFEFIFSTKIGPVRFVLDLSTGESAGINEDRALYMIGAISRYCITKLKEIRDEIKKDNDSV